MDSMLPSSERDVTLTNEVLMEYAEKMELYSGADIVKFINYVKEAPQLQIQRSTHFRRNNVGKWEPCLPGDPGAVLQSLGGMENDSLANRRGCKPSDVESDFNPIAPH